MSRHAASREGDKPRQGFVSFLRETAIVLIIALSLSIILKTFFAQSFYIPSESMESTLRVNDRIMVNKLADEEDDLQRGDIVVFVDPGGWLRTASSDRSPLESFLTWVGIMPANAGQHLVKRIIGMPGDRVVCCDDAGLLQINGVSIEEPYLNAGNEPSLVEFDVTVPAGHIWVLGDNRSRSEDSRYHGGAAGGGFVPIRNIEGRVFVKLWPLSDFEWFKTPEEVYAAVPEADGN